MKKIQIIATVLMLASFSNGAFSQQPPKQEGMMQPGTGMMMQKGKMGGGMMMQQGKMGGGMGMSEEQKDQHMRAMQEHMLMMHELSNKIVAEQNPEKKQALKEQQLEMMKAHRAQMMGNLHKMKPQ